jgi:hypothetical protein
MAARIDHDRAQHLTRTGLDWTDIRCVQGLFEVENAWSPCQPICDGRRFWACS